MKKMGVRENKMREKKNARKFHELRYYNSFRTGWGNTKTTTLYYFTKRYLAENTVYAEYAVYRLHTKVGFVST